MGRDRGATQLDAYVYAPRSAPLALYVISPGLHFAGPDDRRFDRFCRVLAQAGFVVVAPFLPSYVDLRVAPSAVDDLDQVVGAALHRFAALGPPTLFSISFGSWPALEVAARRGGALDGVVTFGGYADFESAVRFCVEGVMVGDDGPVTLPRDPLNSPALFLNLLPFLDVAGDTTLLERAWREMCWRTWGKMELKAPGRLRPFVEELAPGVPERQRELFRIGAGDLPGAAALASQALERGATELAYLSPRAALARIRRPVVVCHGRDDDVIPWGEGVKLARALGEHTVTRLYVTGLFAHTGQGAPRPGAALREAKNLLGVAYTLASAGRLNHVVWRQSRVSQTTSST